MSMEGLLDTKLDARFMEAIDESDELVELVAKWLGISVEQATELVNNFAEEKLKEIVGKPPVKALADILKEIKPDATLRDFLLLKLFTSLWISKGVQHYVAEMEDKLLSSASMDWVAEALRPDEGELLVILVDNEENVGALKASHKVMTELLSIMGKLLTVKAMFEQMKKSLESTAGIIRQLEEANDESKEDTPGDENENT